MVTARRIVGPAPWPESTGDILAEAVARLGVTGAAVVAGAGESVEVIVEAGTGVGSASHGDLVREVLAPGRASAVPASLRDDGLCAVVPIAGPFDEVAGALCVADTGGRAWSDADGEAVAVAAVALEQALAGACRSRVLDATVNAQGAFMLQSDRHAAFHAVLEEVLDVTGARFGIIAARVYDEAGAPFIRTCAVTDIAWDAWSRDIYDSGEASGLEFRSADGLLGAVFAGDQLVVSNAPGSDPRASGTPGGHPPLRSYIGIPVRFGAQQLGMLALADRPGGMHARMALALEPLLAALAHMLVAVGEQECSGHPPTRMGPLLEMAEQTSAGMLMIDLEGRIQWMNDALRLVLLRSVPVEIGAGWTDALHGRVQDADRMALEQAITARADFTAEMRVDRGEGAAADLAMRATLLVARDGEPYGFVVIVEDVSEAHRLRRMQREFLSSVSHELRTPVTSIKGALGLLAGGALGEMPAGAQDVIAIGLRNADTLSHLVNDLIDTERAALGDLRVEVGVHEVAPVLEAAVQDTALFAETQGSSIEADIGPVTGLVADIDPARLGHVLSNLISNAAKFSPDGGVVTVAAYPYTKWLVVDVSDRGPGVPAEFRTSMFERFTQADSSDARSLGGSGLGLALARDLVDAMGGRLTYHDRPGGGSTFRVSLVRVAPGGTAEEAMPAPAGAGVNERLADG